MLGLHVVDRNMTADILRQRLSGYLTRGCEADLRSEAEYGESGKYLDRASVWAIPKFCRAVM